MAKTLEMLEPGDVVIANLNPTLGDEKQKKRPCVVLEPGCTPLKLVIVLPITENNGNRSEYIYVPIPATDSIKLSKPSSIDCYQIRTLSMERLEMKNGVFTVLGRLSDKTMDQIKQRLVIILDICEKHVSWDLGKS